MMLIISYLVEWNVAQVCMVRLVPVGENETKIGRSSSGISIVFLELYLVGISIKARRSMNCIPRNVFTPMYINTPYRTGMGISLGKKYDQV